MLPIYVYIKIQISYIIIIQFIITIIEILNYWEWTVIVMVRLIISTYLPVLLSIALNLSSTTLSPDSSIL